MHHWARGLRPHINLWIPGSARVACARTARSADPSARGPGMTVLKICDAVRLGKAAPSPTFGIYWTSAYADDARQRLDASG